MTHQPPLPKDGRMKQMDVPASGLDRVLTFMAEYQAAPDDADIELRIGLMGEEPGTAKPAVVISINGKRHGFSSDEARSMAQIAEDALNLFPDDPESAGIPNLILILRAGADKAEATAPDHIAGG